MIVQKDAHPVKLISDETMHVYKETKFGGNFFSKLIFFVVLLAIGAALCLSLANNGHSEGTYNILYYAFVCVMCLKSSQWFIIIVGDEKNESSSLLDYFNFGSFFSADEPLGNNNLL